MNKKRISVQIEGRSYAVISADDKEYVEQVANEVTQSIREAASTSTQLDTRDCAVLAALNFCDDRNKALKRNGEFVKKADQIISHTNELNKTISEYKERLAESINHSTKLAGRIRVLEEQLRTLVNENEALKKSPESKLAVENKRKFEQTIQDRKAEKLTGFSQLFQYSLFDYEEMIRKAKLEAEQPKLTAEKKQKTGKAKKNGRK